MEKTWLHCLGQYLARSGFENVLEETYIYGENTIENIFQGLHYNRGVRAHKILNEIIRVVQIFEYLKSRGSSHLINLITLSLFDTLLQSIVDRDDTKVRAAF